MDLMYWDMILERGEEIYVVEDFCVVQEKSNGISLVQNLLNFYVKILSLIIK